MDEQIFTMTIGGAAVEGSARMAVVNPAKGQPFAWAPDCSRAELDLAVESARVAFEGWRRSDLEERRAALRALADVLEGHVDELAALLTREQGKPLADARGEIAIAASRYRGTAEVPLVGREIEREGGRRMSVRHVPLGVVAAIAPWNFPISLATQKIASALLTGNCVVLKPSPLTPLTTLRIGELSRHVLPPGVLNVVSGGDDLGPWLTTHPHVDKISFTGSVEVGRAVMSSAAASLKRVTLELGGNDAAIVFPDVDVKQVARELFWGVFRNAGQICIAVKRIYVHSDIYDAFLACLVQLVDETVVGDGAAPDSQIGPVQNQRQYQRLRELIAETKSSGCRFAAGGNESDGPGYFLPLSIVDNPPVDARIVVEEQFGPIVPLIRFRDEDEAVRLANLTRFGLGGSVWTSDPGRAARVAEQIDSGTVWINEVQRLSPLIPFGGRRDSGIGVEGGVEGLLEYTDLKVISLPE